MKVSNFGFRTCGWGIFDSLLPDDPSGRKFRRPRFVLEGFWNIRRSGLQFINFGSLGLGSKHSERRSGVWVFGMEGFGLMVEDSGLRSGLKGSQHAGDSPNMRLLSCAFGAEHGS